MSSKKNTGTSTHVTRVHAPLLQPFRSLARLVAIFYCSASAFFDSSVKAESASPLARM